MSSAVRNKKKYEKKKNCPHKKDIVFHYIIDIY